MRRIKVVHISNLDVGLKVHLGNYMRYQRDQGYDVSVICHPGHWLTQDTTILDGIFVKIIPFPPRITPWTDTQTFFKLLYYFRQERFDIVHTHTVKPGLLGRLTAKMTGVPIVVHTVHGFYFHDLMRALPYRLFAMIEKLGAICSDTILSQNKQDVETAIREGICTPDKIHHLGNGIDLSQFDPDRDTSQALEALRASLRILPKEPVIGIVVRMVREKGIHEFIEAASFLKARGVRAKYLAIGAPQPDKALSVAPEELVRQYGMEKDILLLGRRDDVPNLIRLMDVVVLPSHGPEGIPRILMEAAALGKPVVATRIRGNIEVVEEGKTGLLVPVADAPALAGAIYQLLQDPELAAAMGRRAHQLALAQFDERFFFWKTDAEYRRLLKVRLAFDPEQILKAIPIMYQI
jgi:glycosyltransferase involved in cell wall biosynthesis